MAHRSKIGAVCKGLHNQITASVRKVDRCGQECHSRPYDLKLEKKNWAWSERIWNFGLKTKIKRNSRNFIMERETNLRNVVYGRACPSKDERKIKKAWKNIRKERTKANHTQSKKISARGWKLRETWIFFIELTVVRRCFILIGKTQIIIECEGFNEWNLIHRLKNGDSQQENIASVIKKTEKKSFNQVDSTKKNNIVSTWSQKWCLFWWKFRLLWGENNGNFRRILEKLKKNEKNFPKSRLDLSSSNEFPQILLQPFV